jgi:3-deoxy-manno-octulosonate cytidylyltransferase (CMP-KDO synthetase)
VKIIGIIPARFASTRFPGKPLVMIRGKSMVQRVYEQAGKASSLGDVLVATDDDRIFNHVQEFGGQAVMTSTSHQSGTDRCAEAVAKDKRQWDAVINIQGDEPFIDPAQIDLVSSVLMGDHVSIATLVKKIASAEDLQNPNMPKVVLGMDGRALYFSRQPIPFVKNTEHARWTDHHTFYRHIGLYGYKASVLREITLLGQGKLEIAESLEQLRWLENGYLIHTAITETDTLAIDSPDDLEKLGSV